MGWKMLLFCFVLLIGFTIGMEKGHALEPTMDGSTVITFSNPWMNKHVKEGLAREWAVSPSTIQDSDLTVANLATIKTFISENNEVGNWASMKLDGIQYLSGIEKFEVYKGVKGEEFLRGNPNMTPTDFMDISPFKSGDFPNLKEFTISNISTRKNGDSISNVSDYYMIFDKMPNLTTLRLNLSYLAFSLNVKTLLNDVLKSNKSITTLDIIFNYSHTIDASFIYMFPNLKEIIFKEVLVDLCTPSSLVTTNLENIDFKKVYFKTLNRSSFWNAPNVRWISMEESSFTPCSSLEVKSAFSADFFKNMPLLESVYLKTFSLYDLTPFVGLDNLQILSVQNGFIYKVPDGIKAPLQDYKYNYLPNQPYQTRLVFDSQKQFVKVSDFYNSTDVPYEGKIGYYLPITYETSDGNSVYKREIFSSTSPVRKLSGGYNENISNYYARNTRTNETWAPIPYDTVLRPQSGKDSSNPYLNVTNKKDGFVINSIDFRNDEISFKSHLQIKFAPLARYANPKYGGTWEWNLKYGDIPIPIEFEFLPDVIAPTFDIVPSVNGWTNGSINVYLRNINDDYSGIETFVNFDGTKSTNLAGRVVDEKYSYNNITTNISNNGTYSFKMIDAAGNETMKTLVVNNIDKIEPTATLENTTTIKSTKNTLKFSNLKDDVNGSGVKGVYLPNNTFVSGSEDVYYDVYERGYYTFGVQDNAGNVKYYSIKVENVYGEDKTPPSISFNPNTFTWSKELKEIQVSIQDENDFNAEYAWTNNPGDEKTYQPLLSNSVRQRTDKDRYLHVRATDFDENISEKISEKIQVDLTAPRFEVVYDDTKWVQQDLELLFTNFTDDNGSGVDYVILPDKNIVYSPTSVSYNVQENGVYFVEVADKVGNRKRVKIEAYNIDSKKPMVKVTQKDAGDNLKIINVYGKDE